MAIASSHSQPPTTLTLADAIPREPARRLLPDALSIADLHALQLAGLGGGERALRALADRQGWRRQERPSRAGGHLYLVADLPEEARRDLETRLIPKPPVADNDVWRPVGRPKGTDFFTRNPDVADAVEAVLLRQKIASPRVMELLGTRFDNLPSLPTLKRFIAALEKRKPAQLALFQDPDLSKSRDRISLGRVDGSVTHAHQVWELDTTPADVMTKGGRKAILCVIDRWSRRARFMVADSESGQSVRRLLIETIVAWGVMPDAVATDNGSGYINRSIVTALEALGIEHKLCPPASPQYKPFVERVFGTFTRERAELLPGYTGHNVAQAQKIRARAKKATGRAEIVAEMEPAELQAVLDAWVDGVYHQRRHTNLGMSPMARWQSSPVPAAAAPSRDKLLLALSAYVGVHTVGKRGIRWKNGRYWSPLLLDYKQRQVIVRRDEDDLGALFVFDEDGRYIDTAINHERAGLSEQEFALQARAQDAAWEKEQRAEGRRKQRAFRYEDAVQARLRMDAEAAGKVVSLPRPTVARSTPQLDSFSAPAPLPVPTPGPAEIARTEALFAARRARVEEDDIVERVRATDAVLAAQEAGQQIEPAALRRAEAFATHPRYRAFKMMEAHALKENAK